MHSSDEHAGAAAEVDFAKLFAEIKTVAVVGYSDNPDRAGHYVAQYLAAQGYRVIAVNPRYGPEVDHLPCFPNLAAISASESVDVVDVFRSPAFVPPLVDEAAGLKPLPKYFWMQPGAENLQAAELARQRGMTPIMEACMMAAHKIWGGA